MDRSLEEIISEQPVRNPYLRREELRTRLMLSFFRPSSSRIVGDEAVETLAMRHAMV